MSPLSVNQNKIILNLKISQYYQEERVFFAVTAIGLYHLIYLIKTYSKSKFNLTSVQEGIYKLTRTFFTFIFPKLADIFSVDGRLFWGKTILMVVVVGW